MKKDNKRGIMKIGKAYKLYEENNIKLCADIDNNGTPFTMFFEVKKI